MLIANIPKTSALFLYTDFEIFLHTVFGASVLFNLRFQTMPAMSKHGRVISWNTTLVPNLAYTDPPRVEPMTLPKALDVQHDP